MLPYYRWVVLCTVKDLVTIGTLIERFLELTRIFELHLLAIWMHACVIKRLKRLSLSTIYI
jgi:hypothetical protein